MLIDTHAHLFFDNFKSDLDFVIKQSSENGISYIIIPGTSLETSRQAVEIAQNHDIVYAAVGIHPHDTANWNGSKIAELEELCKEEKVVAIGEIGLDYYYDFSPKTDQIKAFQAQIELALKLDLPIIVHNRESNVDIMDFARRYKDTNLRTQYHCFSGSVEDAKELIEMGHYLSFPGNITFKRADSLREIVGHVDVDNLLLETDSPFMTPVPHRGKRNEPIFVKFVAETVADIHGITYDEVVRRTYFNAVKLFSLENNQKVSFTYQIGNSLYINITNRCNADCVFCNRKGDAELKGYKLKMAKSEEPDAKVYINEIGDPNRYDEVVFCGYGEPTIRWDIVKDVAKYIKDNGGKTRINTDGHGNVINKRDITPELKGLIDTVSISLNSVDPEQYAKLMRIDKSMHAEMMNFAKKAKEFSKVVMTIVGIDGVDRERAKQLVTEEIGADYRERAYF